MAKSDRIKRLIPDAEQFRVYLPTRCPFVDYEKKQQDLTIHIVQEWKDFPISAHDDALDCLSRIKDPDVCAQYPMEVAAQGMMQQAGKAKTSYDPYAED